MAQMWAPSSLLRARNGCSTCVCSRYSGVCLLTVCVHVCIHVCQRSDLSWGGEERLRRKRLFTHLHSGGIASCPALLRGTAILGT